jgi:hypothetical protein
MPCPAALDRRLPNRVEGFRQHAVWSKSDEHSVLLDALSGELEAIRQVVDGLPTLGSVTRLEDGQISIKRDTEAVRKEVRQIAAEQR